MRVLIRQILLNWHTIIFLVSMAMILVGVVWMAISYQRRDYQRTLAQAIDQIRTEVRTLKLQNDDIQKSQDNTRRAVEDVKEAVQP